MEAELNEKQVRFCEEYLIDLNATQAAIRAGYSKKTAYSIGWELLKKPEIRLRIDGEIEQRSKRTLITADYVIEKLKQVAERSMQDQPVMKWDYGEKMMLQETATILDEQGEEKEVGVYEFDSMGANKALELLGKHLKLFTDKVEESGSKELTIKVQYEKKVKSE